MSVIKEFYDRRLAERAIISIPEWDRQIYVGPLTMGQWVEIDKVDDGALRNLEVVVTCAKREDGFPAFTGEEVEDMRRYGDPALIARIAMQIVETHNRYSDPIRQKKIT